MLRAVFGRGWRRWSELTVQRRRELLIAALLLFAYGFFQQSPAWNEYSRYDLTRALVEQGTTRIDSYDENTGDKAFYQGHWYSDKAPGTALLGVPVYALLDGYGRLTGAGTPEQADAVQVLAFVESGIATMVLVLLLVRFLVPFVGEGWALAVGLAYGFGSIAFPFATMFFGHAASTAALFASFYLLHRHRHQPATWRPILAGFLAGWAVLIELPVVLGVAVLALYAMVAGRRAVITFVLGGAPLAIVFALYNWVSFGSPLSTGYMNLLPGGFASGMSEGILGVSWPRLDTLVDLLFGPRGLIRLAPWLILAPAGVLALRRRELRAEVVASLAIVVLFLTYNSGYYLPFGGMTPGPRFLLPALPFAAVLVALIPTWLRFVAVPLMLAAAAIFLVATATMPNAPEGVDDPVFGLWLPRLVSGELAESAAWIRWGLHGSTVLAVLLGVLAFGLIALAATFGRASLAERASVRAPVVLAALALGFSVPIPPLAPVALGWPGDPAPPAVVLVELGHTPAVVAGAKEIDLWARFENRGGAIPSGREWFRVWGPGGNVVFSAWYGDLLIPGASRATVTMAWHPGESPPGPYTYGFTVSEEKSGAPFADVRAAAVITIGG
jgi:hypothetical protein